MDSLNMLVEITKNYCLQGQSECDTHTSKWLGTRCKAMCLKVKYVITHITHVAEEMRELITVI